MALPEIISKQEYFVDTDIYNTYPEYFKELNDPDIVDVYIPSKKPTCFENTNSYYWAILHFYRSKSTGKAYRIIRYENKNLYIEIKDRHKNDDTFNDINEARSKIFDYKKKALNKKMRQKCKEILSKPEIDTNQITIDSPHTYPDMVVTVDGIFEMYVVCIQESNTWPAHIILDKWYYSVEPPTEPLFLERYKVHERNNTILWALKWSRKFDCFDNKNINIEPIPYDADIRWSTYRHMAYNPSIPYQFCRLDDAEQFAYSLCHLMEINRIHEHSIVLHRLMIDEHHRCTYLYPVERDLNDKNSIRIDYDKENKRWILIKPKNTNEIIR